MKGIFTFLVALFLSAHLFAQAPQKMSYQAVIRNGSNILVSNKTVGMRISVLQGSVSGTPVYVETQNPTTNANGLASLEVGAGMAVLGTFSSINWANGPYFIKTETDPFGGGNYNIIAISQLMSVPYALYAERCATPAIADGTSPGNTTYWNGTKWVENSSNIYNNGGSIGMGTTSPDSTAVLDMTSSTKGVLIPRMTSTNRNAIANPATGLLVFQTDAPAGFYYYDGVKWLLLDSNTENSSSDKTLIYTTKGF